MAQNPAPVTKKATMQKPAKSWALKRDINLIPVNENAGKTTRMAGTVLVVLLAVAALAYVIIWIPTSQLNDLRARADSASTEVAKYQKVDQEMTALIAQRKTLLNMLNLLDNTDKNSLEPSDMVDKIAKACPKTVILQSLELSMGGLVLSGTADNDDTIAQLIVNLKSLGDFQTVTLVSVQQATSPASTYGVRQFQIKANLTIAASASPSASATAAPENTTKGGDGK